MSQALSLLTPAVGTSPPPSWSASPSFRPATANSASCRPPNMTAIPPPSSTNSTPSNPEGATVTPGGAEIQTGFSLPPSIVFGYTLSCAVVVVEGATV